MSTTDTTAVAAVAAKPSEWETILAKMKGVLAEAKEFLGIATADIDAAQPLIAAGLAVADPAAAGIEVAAVGALNATNDVAQAGSVTVAVANLHNAVTAVEATVAATQTKADPAP